MDLGDRPGRERCGIDVLEDVLPRHAELLLHHLDDLLLAERWDIVLELRQLDDELRRDQVGTGREDLPELAEGRAQLLERLTQPLRLADSTDRAFVVGASEELLQPMLGEDRGDRGSTCHEVRLCLGLDGARTDRREAPWVAHGARDAVGRVHDDHGAPRVVADPVGHVSQQKLFATSHAGVPDDEHIDLGRLGRVHDRHRGVVVDHHVRAAAAAGDPLRFLLQVFGGRGRPGALGRSELGVGRARGDHDLDEVQLGAVRLRERSRPSDRLRRGLRSVGPNHHAADGAVPELGSHASHDAESRVPLTRVAGARFLRGACTPSDKLARTRRSSSGVEQPPRKW